jgi:enoyl-CoA hydratase/carnithine racemase
MHTLGRQRASEIALLATPITAQHGYHLGFVNKVVKHDELMDKAMEWAVEVCKGSPQAIALTKRALGAALSGRGLEDA